MDVTFNVVNEGRLLIERVVGESSSDAATNVGVVVDISKDIPDMEEAEFFKLWWLACYSSISLAVT